MAGLSLLRIEDVGEKALFASTTFFVQAKRRYADLE
jgi:hypothetical protein